MSTRLSLCRQRFSAPLVPAGLAANTYDSVLSFHRRRQRGVSGCRGGWFLLASRAALASRRAVGDGEQERDEERRE
jgi:hypothetical protein